LKRVGQRIRMLKKAIIKSKRRKRTRVDITEIHTFVGCKKYLNKINGKKKNGK
jgi:hypothetical protein